MVQLESIGQIRYLNYLSSWSARERHESYLKIKGKLNTFFFALKNSDFFIRYMPVCIIMSADKYPALGQSDTSPLEKVVTMLSAARG